MSKLNTAVCEENIRFVYKTAAHFCPYSSILIFDTALYSCRGMFLYRDRFSDIEILILEQDLTKRYI